MIQNLVDMKPSEEFLSFGAGTADSVEGERPLLFLDFEASSLSPWSWPIEIGFAWIEAGEVRSQSFVIAPRRIWPLSDWCEAAQDVHGLRLARVMTGVAADRVAALTDGFEGFDIVSDNPVWEQRWLDRLREGRAPGPRVLSLGEETRRRLAPAEADHFCSALFRGTPAHRAEADARRLAEAWHGATRALVRAA